MALEVIHDPQTFQRRMWDLRRQGRTLGFVPTMGALHDGHLSLFHRAREENDVVAISIFVNPTQFAPNEDLSRYPRDPEGDLAKAEALGVDIVLMPSPETMYPSGYQTYVEVTELQKPLCGAFRPGHFRGVATVVTKLLLLALPHRAYFGRKDFQQWRLIERLVLDLGIPTTVVSMPIVREPDGLAMSSRNRYLSPEEREAARALYRGLRAAKDLFAQGETRPDAYVQTVRHIFTSTPGVRAVDYVELRDGETLEPATRVVRGTLLALAAHVGPARLIDNWWMGIDTLELIPGYNVPPFPWSAS